MPGDATRRDFLARSAAAVLAAGGLYELVDGLAAPARAAAATAALPPEQHLLVDVPVITDNGVQVLVPPLHHQLVTAKLRVGRTKAALLDGKRELEQALKTLDRSFAPTPAGLGLVVAWGLPYFRRYVAAPWASYAPRDLRANGPALLDAILFPSDPTYALLEQNDVVVHLRSDSLAHIAQGARAIFDRLDGMFKVTSIRKGFVGGGFGGKRSLPKQMALKAGIPGALRIPDNAQLFLGFTSTQQSALGPDAIANLETLPGLTDQWPDGYFRNGTTMHVSHLYLDLEQWYREFDFDERTWAAFRPGLSVPTTTRTLPEGLAEVTGVADVLADFRTNGLSGHSSTLQPATRLPEDTMGNYGTAYPRGTPVIQRPDFNTLDSPFAWTSNPFRDRWSSHPSAGLHFIGFAPTSDTFHRARLAMDGHYADGTVLSDDPRSARHGFNAVLQTTHRQNFLVPPRRHRSFPLAELL
ncbi:MAG: DUF7405 family protein [Gaiellaceae bacterium]